MKATDNTVPPEESFSKEASFESHDSTNFKNAGPMQVSDLKIVDGYVILSPCRGMDQAEEYKAHFLDNMPRIKGFKINPDWEIVGNSCVRTDNGN